MVDHRAESIFHIVNLC